MIEIRHLRYKPAIGHHLKFCPACIRIKKYLVLITGLRKAGPLMQPVFHRRVQNCMMLYTHVIIHSILYDLDPFFVSGINKFMISFISAKSWIYFIMISKSITMFSTVIHIIFNDGVKP